MAASPKPPFYLLPETAPGTFLSLRHVGHSGTKPATRNFPPSLPSVEGATLKEKCILSPPLGPSTNPHNSAGATSKEVRLQGHSWDPLDTGNLQTLPWLWYDHGLPPPNPGDPRPALKAPQNHLPDSATDPRPPEPILEPSILS